MRQLFTCFLAIAFFPFCATAQASFTVSPNPSAKTASSNQTDIENHNNFSYKVASPDTFRWTRTEVFMSDPSLQSQVCDNTACYLPGVSTKTFTVDPLESFDMIIHLLNPNKIPAQAIIHIKFTNESNPSDSLNVVYTFDVVTGTSIPLPNAGISLAPNPASDFVQLTGADQVAAVRLYTLSGQLVFRRDASPDQRYAVGDLQPGTYVMAFENEAGRLIQATELVKF